MLDKKLNGNQLQAIKHSDGPLLIIAGAGTGKTTVIVEKIKFLIARKLAKPDEILALTFTEKGAREMEDRVDVALPLGYGSMWISTFHSFCDLVLRESGIEIGLSSDYKLMTSVQSINLIKKNLFDFELDYFRPLGNPNKFIEKLLQHFSRLQDEFVTPEEYLEYSKKFKSEEPLDEQKTMELSNLYNSYSLLKIKENSLDFGDLINYTIKLFKERPNVLKKYQKKFKYILVDEFQDTNFAQSVLIDLLANDSKNITVVGDDNQSIYRFRGAAISNIIQFNKKYTKAKVVTLNTNYRSNQEILDSSYKLIKNNDPDTLEYRLGINKKLISINKSNSLKKFQDKFVEFIHTRTGQDEAIEVSKKIISLIKKTKGKIKYSDIAILVRANNHADIFIRQFERLGIPHQFLGPSKLFEKEEIIDLISYLKVLSNPEDSISFYRLLSSKVIGLSSLSLIKVSNLAKKRSKSLFEIVADNIDNDISEKSEEVLKLLTLIDKHIKEINCQTAGQILFDYINEMGIYSDLINNNLDVKAKNISKFFEIIKNYEDTNDNSNVISFVDYLQLLIEIGESPNVSEGDWQENNAVNMLTIHSAKGLEFPVVFLVNLVNERFPSRERHEQIPIPEDLIKEILPTGDYHLQEERRLFYVGMTRAKEKLFLTAADYYNDGKRQKKISTFVYEALGSKDLNDNSFNTHDFKKIYEKQIHISKKDLTNKPKKINYLSVSQIETFKTCPLHYKLKYIYRLPTPPSASISFGLSIHKTLKEYFETKNDILEIYKNNWIEEGFLNKKHKNDFYKKGEQYLLGFLENGYNSKVKTIALEEKFTIKIDDGLKIGGTIDRLDDLGKGRYEIIDYKTGANIPTQKEVDKNMQLSFYSLAISVLYNTEPENIKLSLYYLDTQEKITTRRTKKDLDNLKLEILEVKNEIENSDFKCNNNYFCQQGCEFSMFCNVTN